jgi:hypothetical protein
LRTRDKTFRDPLAERKFSSFETFCSRLETGSDGNTRNGDAVCLEISTGNAAEDWSQARQIFLPDRSDSIRGTD